MKKIILILAAVLTQQYSVNSQSLSPHVLATAGGYFAAGGSSLSWTMGETFNTTLQNGSVILTQGQQQPYVQLTILNLKVFIEGFYIGGGLMNNCLNITGVSGDPLDADVVTISAMDAAPPHNLVEAQIGTLKTNGDVTVTFSPLVIPNTSYYIKVNHRNSVETWSANPVILTASTMYSFTSSASQAYASNQATTFDALYAAMYSGDINQDGAIDGSDFLEFDPASQAGAGGYEVADVNGDGAVDGSDFLVFDPNSQNGVGAAIPFP